jgi:putative transposase
MPSTPVIVFHIITYYVVHIRIIGTFTLHQDGTKIKDEQNKELLCQLIAGDGYPYGYKKLTVCLQEDYKLLLHK